MNLDKKLKLAHEWSMWFLDKNKDMEFAPNTVAYNAWQYADAMEAEAEKRIKARAEKGAEDAKVFFDKLTMADSPQLEFQVDWSVSPDSAMYWAMDEDTFCNWYERDPQVIGSEWDFGNVLEIAPSFKYHGDWKDSLRKRPK